MKKLPVNIGITDTNLCINDCSTFLITFPPDEEFANDSKIGWNPWGYKFSFVYDFSKGVLILSDDYTTIKIDESIEDAIMALKVYEGGPEWYVEYREDVNSWKPAQYVPSKRIPNFGKWERHRHVASSNDICFSSSGIEEVYIGGEPYQEGSNTTIDNFYSYLYGDGNETLINVANSIVDYLKKE